ncbi:MAG: hypothetical protein KHZ99_02595 [Clostridium sp.]|uniref:hypothetical protein n=1 Tax=Clostridium sp. TaxID=1506 RepID=UPI0025BB730A|nr:hypothetical protein [Clostridium sp.]MBS4955928.1 hypothetical protein [Clostridium sp.]
MKNIINLIKFDIKAQKVQLIIEISIIVFLTIQLSIFWSKLPSELIFIPVVSMILIVNSIMLIVKFLKSISIDEGRLLFIAPIKGWELVFSKYLEFICLGLILIVFTIIGTMVTGGNINLLLMTSMSILWGFFILFILITSLSVIFKSYFSNTGICIVLTVISMAIISGVISILKLVTYFIFPSVYIVIGEFFELNLFNIFVNVVTFGLLIFSSIYHIDKKLDIV